MKQSTFENIFKISLLIMGAFFLYIIYSIKDKIMEKDIGRFQLSFPYYDTRDGYIIDTKTGRLFDTDGEPVFNAELPR